MQETTFKSLSGEAEFPLYKSVNDWLSALYSDKLSSKDEVCALILQKEFFELLNKLQKNLGYQFYNPQLLVEALTHSTFHYEFKSNSIPFNERLEFLGDSIVNLIVGKNLFRKYPLSSEGELSRLRGALVNENALSVIAKSIELGDFLLLGKGEFKNKGNQKASLLADAFEALIAAIYFDANEDMALVEDVFNTIIKKYEQIYSSVFYSDELLKTFDSKSTLQEITMELYKIHPNYKSIEHDSQFLVELWIGDRKIVEKKGQSKKKLEKELAQEVLENKKYLL